MHTSFPNSTAQTPERTAMSKTMQQSSSLDQHHLISEHAISNGLVECPRGITMVTPTGSLNKKRQNSVDSPSLGRNPLRKLSNSSSTGQAGAYEEVKKNGPELPAIHFFNSKMQNNLSRPGSITVHNAMFDSLKAGQASQNLTSPISPKSTVSEGGRLAKTINSPTTARSKIAAVQPLRKTQSEPTCRPLMSPPKSSSNSQYARIIPHQFRCPSPTGNFNVRKVSEETIPEDSVLVNSEVFPSPVKDYPPKIVHQTRIGNEYMDDENHYTSLSNCNSRPPPIPPHQKLSTNEEDQFVTGVYREPIDRCHSTTSSIISSASSDKTMIIHDDVTEEKQKSSHKCSMEIGPPNRGLVASIDGKTMSLLPVSNNDNLKSANKDKSSQFNSYIIETKSKNNSSNSNKGSNFSIPPLNGLLSPSKLPPERKKEYRRSYPAMPQSKPMYISPPQKKKEMFNQNFVSDDDKESISSRPHSDNSSIVFLNPIELKPSRNAFIRQLPHQDGKQGVLNYVFSSPYNTLDKFKSRSSDTINSIPYRPPTPKFPVPPEISTSLTKLLIDLTGEADAMQNDQFYFEYDDLDSFYPKIAGLPPKSPETKSKFYQKNLHHANQPHQYKDGNGNTVDNQAALPQSPRKLQQPRMSANAFQVKRRTPHGAPVRHCRSLDYIPSDREDNMTSSPASSHHGSPKNRHHAYLMPLIFGTQHTMVSKAEHTSLSSLASSSEMSQSDPHINTDSGSAAYESEYDNYRPGATSDDDYFGPGPISDVDLDMFDDVNIDDVTVSDNFSLDMPVPRFRKKITEV